MKNIKEAIRNIVKEESEYQTFFKKALEKSGKSISQMSDDEKKAFFNKIDAAWDGKGEKNEELVGNQHKLDVDGDGEIEASDLAALRAGKKADEAMESGNWVVENSKPKVGDQLIMVKNGKKGKVIKCMDDMCNVDFGHGDVYGITYSRIKGNKITEASDLAALRAGKKADEAMESGNWVGFTKTPKGKKLAQTFKSGNQAKAWAIKNNGGAMPKKDWDEKEAKYAVESVNENKLNAYISSNDGKTFTIYNSNKEKVKNVSREELEKLMRVGNNYSSDFNWTEFMRKFDKTTNLGKYWKYWKGTLINVVIPSIGETKSIEENFSPSDVEKIKKAVQNSASFMQIGRGLQQLGFKYSFGTSPYPIYMIKKGAKTYVLINKKYADDPEFVIGDTAGGLLEGVVAEGKFKSGDKVSISHPTMTKPVKGVVSMVVNASGNEVLVLKGDGGVWDAKFATLNEGNAFGAAVTAAKKEGKKEFEFNGKKYKVKKGSYEKNESAKKLAEKTQSVTKK